MIAKSPMVVAVNNSVPAKSLAELVALDKAQPGKLAAANEGAKTFSGMMSQLLNKSAGIGLLQVYGIWIAVILILYLPCRWFSGVKRRRRDVWLSYL